MGLILASSSPRRRELLATLGLDFRVVPGTELDEATILTEAQGELSQRLEQLARLKGEAAAREAPADVVISADTVVEIGGEVLGKPRDVDEARAMLTRLAGRTHRVHTAVAVQQHGRHFLATGCETTEVTFDVLDSEMISRYVARAQPFDKAGAYAIQGLGALLVRKIKGDYANVVGLPLRLTAHLLTAAGVQVL
jgi:septum formation protein